MKNILVLTDFSENAWNSLKQTISSFNNNVCTFHLLNTYTPSISSYRLMTTNLNNEEIKNNAAYTSKTALEKLKKHIKESQDNSNHTFTYNSSFCLLKDEIKELIEKKDINLIIMGAKGASNTQEVSIGSNTIRIIKSIKNCPLLIIPKYANFTIINKVTLATDFNHFYNQLELSPLLKLAKSLNAGVEIVQIQNKVKQLTKQQQFNREALQKHLNNIKYKIQTLPKADATLKDIEKLTDEFNTHLVVIPNHLHNYIERLTYQPVIKKEFFYLKTPLLIIPETKVLLSKKSTKQDLLAH